MDLTLSKTHVRSLGVSAPVSVLHLVFSPLCAVHGLHSNGGKDKTVKVGLALSTVSAPVSARCYAAFSV